MCTAILNNVQVGANRVIHTVPYLVNNSSGQIRAHSTATFSYTLSSFGNESVDRRHDRAPHCKGRRWRDSSARYTEIGYPSLPGKDIGDAASASGELEVPDS